jgi:hypothetical protein
MFRGHSLTDLVLLGLIRFLQFRQVFSNGTDMVGYIEQNKRLVLDFVLELLLLIRLLD